MVVIPVCSLLDWLSPSPHHPPPRSTASVIRVALGRVSCSALREARLIVRLSLLSSLLAFLQKRAKVRSKEPLPQASCGRPSRQSKVAARLRMANAEAAEAALDAADSRSDASGTNVEEGDDGDEGQQQQQYQEGKRETVHIGARS